MIGRLVGNFRIVALLGEGGFGKVYLAQHPEVEEQKQAIKMLHAHVAAIPEIATRFLKEVQASAKLAHRNIVRITDFGRLDGATPYYCMEYLNGYDVEKLIRHRRQVAFIEVIGVIAQGGL